MSLRIRINFRHSEIVSLAAIMVCVEANKLGKIQNVKTIAQLTGCSIVVYSYRIHLLNLTRFGIKQFCGMLAVKFLGYL